MGEFFSHQSYFPVLAQLPEQAFGLLFFLILGRVTIRNYEWLFFDFIIRLFGSETQVYSTGSLSSKISVRSISWPYRLLREELSCSFYILRLFFGLGFILQFFFSRSCLMSK
mmetsp:Transcript_28495/g.43076  ORF Transcript_28495/g.43076 Transcript_28495/m.43076 type:complete len:112 (-) Transcript_28495:650-985(-)